MTTRSATSGRVLVRDSKDRQGPVLTFTPESWQAFVSQADEF